MKSSINIDHSSASVTTSGDNCLVLSNNGIIKLGKGINVQGDTIDNSNPLLLQELEGGLRFNEDTQHLEYCDGSHWIEIVTVEDNSNLETIYSFLF